jgi:hypothetical protein
MVVCSAILGIVILNYIYEEFSVEEIDSSDT